MVEAKIWNVAERNFIKMKPHYEIVRVTEREKMNINSDDNNVNETNN